MQYGIETEAARALPKVETETPQMPPGIENEAARMQYGIETEAVRALPKVETETPQMPLGIENEAARMQYGIETEAARALPEVEAEAARTQPEVEAEAEAASMQPEAEAEAARTQRQDEEEDEAEAAREAVEETHGHPRRLAEQEEQAHPGRVARGAAAVALVACRTRRVERTLRRDARGGREPAASGRKPAEQPETEAGDKNPSEQRKKKEEVLESVDASVRNCFVIDFASFAEPPTIAALGPQLYQLLFSELPAEFFVSIVSRSRPKTTCASCSLPVTKNIVVQPRRRLLTAGGTNATLFAFGFEAARLHRLLPRDAKLHLISADKGAEVLLASLKPLGRSVALYSPNALPELPLPPHEPVTLPSETQAGDAAADVVHDLEVVVARAYQWLGNASANSPAGLPGTVSGLHHMLEPLCHLREPVHAGHVLYELLSRSLVSLCTVCAAFQYAPAFLQGTFTPPDPTSSSQYQLKVYRVLSSLVSALRTTRRGQRASERWWT